MPVSGPDWVKQFPTSISLDDLAEPFRSKAASFVGALRAGGATVTIGDTLRPPQRAYLMCYSFQIAMRGLDPAKVPAMAGVDIEWVHMNGDGEPDGPASLAAAKAMVAGYDIVHQPALQSRHTQGLAIDMNIEWEGDLEIARPDGGVATVSSVPRSGGNADLHALGASYGVIKLVSDPPHWSSDGH